jgi:hypothetical protein
MFILISILYLSPQVHYVHIGSEPQVIGKVPAGMIWICIDGNCVGIPVPITAIDRVKLGNVPIPVAERESSGRAARQSPHVLATVPTLPAAVFPGILNSIVLIVAPGVVTDPVRAVNMGVVGMPVMILKVPALVILMAMAVILPWSLERRSSRILAINTVGVIIVLCECGKRENEDACQSEGCNAHGSSLLTFQGDMHGREMKSAQEVLKAGAKVHLLYPTFRNRDALLKTDKELSRSHDKRCAGQATTAEGVRSHPYSGNRLAISATSPRM